MTIFNQSNFPNMASHCDQSKCEFCLYKGVLIQWDEDYDKRILEVIDNMPTKVVNELLITQEHEGGIAFIWKNSIPKGYEENGPGINISDGDWWCVTSSIVFLNGGTK